MGSSWTRDWACISCIGRQVLYHWATREAPESLNHCIWQFHPALFLLFREIFWDPQPFQKSWPLEGMNFYRHKADHWLSNTTWKKLWPRKMKCLPKSFASQLAELGPKPGFYPLTKLTPAWKRKYNSNWVPTRGRPKPAFPCGQWNHYPCWIFLE